MPHPKPIKPSLAQQGALLRAVQPDSEVQYQMGGKRLVWRGYLQPTPVSERYRIRIEMDRSTRRLPRVYVEAPQLETREGEQIPHLYSQQKKQLCLWRPKYQEWSRRMWIAHSILLWASAWLFFYEVWYATGEWLGGGEHPPPDLNE